MGKLFLESEFQHKGNKQLKKRKFSAKSYGFLSSKDSENIIIQILHRKGQIKKWIELSSLGQEPTEPWKGHASFIFQLNMLFERLNILFAQLIILFERHN